MIRRSRCRTWIHRRAEAYRVEEDQSRKAGRSRSRPIEAAKRKLHLTSRP
jgi:hypothetical protein